MAQQMRLKNWFWQTFGHVVGFIVGLVVSAVLVFTVFFLFKVIPHGGL